MASLLPTIITSNSPKHLQQQPYIVLQSSSSQSCLPILSAIVQHARENQKRNVLLVSFLYPPQALHLGTSSDRVQVLDWTDRIPDYYEDSTWNMETELLRAVTEASAQGTIDIVIDSADTLLSNLGSQAKLYLILHKIQSLLRSKANSSRLIIHLVSPYSFPSSSPTSNQNSNSFPASILSTSFSSTLTHLIAHPPSLLKHINNQYLLPPPPYTNPSEKFWSVFIPFSERSYDVEQTVFCINAEGPSGDAGEIVVEIIQRGAGLGSGDNSGRRRGVERVLEGWICGSSEDNVGKACPLVELESLKKVFSKKGLPTEEVAPDPTQNVSFNLHLTAEQQQSRAQVPLPYAHEGNPIPAPQAGSILYDPDSADDIDDDDPDEDLDI
ncbi:hypothetical protein C8Q75DRAFT_750243 [Abortiporus biennis]|nr:hypothetical protein C8Q75DRAFT_750243 [Abortiporus biennis]